MLQWSSTSHQFCDWPRSVTDSWLIQTLFSFPNKTRKTQDSFDSGKPFLFPEIPCQQCDHRYPCAVLQSFPYFIFNLCYLLELKEILFSLKLQTAKKKSCPSGKSCFPNLVKPLAIDFMHHMMWATPHVGSDSAKHLRAYFQRNKWQLCNDLQLRMKILSIRLTSVTFRFEPTICVAANTSFRT